MGKLSGHRQVTIYIDPELYETARCAAYSLGENIYDFITEAVSDALGRRLTKSEREAITSMARTNIKNVRGRRRRSTASSR